MRVVILGSGNVAQAIATALSKHGTPPVQIIARNSQQGAQLASQVGCDFTDDYSNPAVADIYIIAVSDKAIDIVASKLNIDPNSVIAHTAGSIELGVLGTHRNHAVFYPLQTFSKSRDVDFRPIPILIEANTPLALDRVMELGNELSENVQVVSSQQRAKVHLAAVFASNFTNHMYVIAEQLLEAEALNFNILKPLIRETAEKAISAESPAKVQTGPAVRNDFKTKDKHCNMLQQPHLKSLYTNLSKNIWETSKKI